jgi:hypothetical protein
MFDFLNTLADNARIWIYQSNRLLTASEVEAITTKAQAFTQSWSSHSRKVDSAAQVLFDRFLIIAANEEQFNVSGCGIDSSVHFVKALGQELGIDFFDRFNIAYKEGEEVKAASRKEFEQLVESGAVNENTTIFNNMVTTKKDLVQGWMVPMKASWHANVFAVHCR